MKLDTGTQVPATTAQERCQRWSLEHGASEFSGPWSECPKASLASTPMGGRHLSSPSSEDAAAAMSFSSLGLCVVIYPPSANPEVPQAGSVNRGETRISFSCLFSIYNCCKIKHPAPCPTLNKVLPLSGLYTRWVTRSPWPSGPSLPSA